MRQVFLKGLVFGIGVVLILGLGYSAVAFIVDTRAKAVQGAEAFKFLDAQLRAQQSQKETK